MEAAESKRRKYDVGDGDESSQLLHILPDMIWSQVLPNLHTAQDYCKICASFPASSDLFSGNRTRALFGDVVKIFVRRLENQGEQDNHNNLQLPNLVFMRRTCYSWKRGVDSALQNLAYNYKFLHEHKLPNSQFLNDLDFKYSYRFRTLRDYEKFDNRFETHGKNPFITRRITVSMNPDRSKDELDVCFSSCLDMLKNFGSHVWYLYYEADVGPTYCDRHPGLFFEMLKNILQFLPNLRVLRIELPLNCHVDHFVHSFANDGDGQVVSTIPSVRTTHKLNGYPVDVFPNLHASRGRVEPYVSVVDNVNPKVMHIRGMPHPLMQIQVQAVPGLFPGVNAQGIQNPLPQNAAVVPGGQNAPLVLVPANPAEQNPRVFHLRGVPPAPLGPVIQGLGNQGFRFGQPLGAQLGQALGAQIGQPLRVQFGQPLGRQFGQPLGAQFGQLLGAQIGQPAANREVNVPNDQDTALGLTDYNSFAKRKRLQSRMGPDQKQTPACKTAVVTTMRNLRYVDQGQMPFGQFMQIIQSNLSSLTQLGVTLENAQESDTFFSLPLKLTKLELNVCSTEMPWNESFSLLENAFGQTLQHLHVWLCKKSVPESDFKLKLPKLKMLHLMIDGVVPLDFLLGMTNHLEEFHLKIKCMSRQDWVNIQKAEGIIRFYQYLNDLTSSNIWIQFPKLQKVRLSSHVEVQNATPFWTCTREEWRNRSN